MQGKALEQGRRWTGSCKVPVQSCLVCQVQWRISKGFWQNRKLLGRPLLRNAVPTAAFMWSWIEHDNVIMNREASDYLFTYSIEQSPSWEANWFCSQSRNSPHFWNPKVPHRIHKCPPPVPILSHLHPVPTTPSHFLKIQLNIVLPPTSGSPQWSLSLRFTHQNPVHTSPLSHTRHMPRGIRYWSYRRSAYCLVVTTENENYFFTGCHPNREVLKGEWTQEIVSELNSVGLRCFCAKFIDCKQQKIMQWPCPLKLC